MPKKRQALLEDVLANPDSDLPRIAYADGCDEVGDIHRGRFVRLQLEATHRQRAGDYFAFQPSSAARDLLCAHGAEWAGPIKDRVAFFDFYRGFVEAIKIDAKQFLNNATELYALAPIRKLFIFNIRPVMSEFFSSPHLSRIAALSLEGQDIGDEGVRLVANSPHLVKLMWLGLSVNEVTLEGVEALAASTTLPSLKQVDFGGNPAEVVQEVVGQDDGVPPRVWAAPSPKALRIEAKYGRKRWLHTVEDHGYRIPLVLAEC